ncbi:MAG TPA: hypothetical protein VJ872_03225 [Nocardioides sp.]|nr:hypothetical protein [Nocardioides sp.]
MEILLWLVPASVVTGVAMLVVGWLGRDERGQVDRETAARLLGEALSAEPRHNPGYALERRTPERSTGVALRPSRQRPVLLQGEAVELAPDVEGVVVKETRAS